MGASLAGCDARDLDVCEPIAERCNDQDDDCDGETDEGGVCTVSTPDPEPPAPSGGCPSSGIQVTAGSSLLASCGEGLQIITWDNSSQERASSPGQPLVIANTRQGFAYVTTRCGTEWRTPPTGSATQAGFTRICSEGVDITNASRVCSRNDGNKLVVALNPSEAGRCE